MVRATLAIAWKDVRLELRSRDIIASALIFGLIVVVVFIRIEPPPGSLAPVAPGLLWVAYAFIGVLAMSRAFSRELEQGGLDGLLSSPISRDAIFLGKSAGQPGVHAGHRGHAVAGIRRDAGFAHPVAYPGAGHIAGDDRIRHGWHLFAGIAVQTRSRETLLPLLFFPVVVPVIIGAVEASALVLQGSPLWPVWGRWVPLLVVFDAVYLVICPWIFGFVFEG